jgi:hypothetical protein
VTFHLDKILHHLEVKLANHFLIQEHYHNDHSILSVLVLPSSAVLKLTSHGDDMLSFYYLAQYFLGRIRWNLELLLS